MTKVFCRIKFIDDLLWLKYGINNPESCPIKFASLFWDAKFAEHKKKFIDGLSKAIEVAEPNMPLEERSALVAAFSAQYRKPRKSKKAMVNLKANLLKILGSFPKALRELIFSCLLNNLKKRLRNSNFQVNYAPVFQLSEEDLMSSSLKNWERILLMPREELRLRANI